MSIAVSPSLCCRTQLGPYRASPICCSRPHKTYLPTPVQCSRKRQLVLLCRSQQPNEKPSGMQGVLEKHLKQWQVGSADILRALTPKAEGDALDWMWMTVSTVVLVLLAAQLYRVYAYLYMLSGAQTISSFMGH